MCLTGEIKSQWVNGSQNKNFNAHSSEEKLHQDRVESLVEPSVFFLRLSSRRRTRK